MCLSLDFKVDRQKMKSVYKKTKTKKLVKPEKYFIFTAFQLKQFWKAKYTLVLEYSINPIIHYSKLILVNTKTLLLHV